MAEFAGSCCPWTRQELEEQALPSPALKKEARSQGRRIPSARLGRRRSELANLSSSTGNRAHAAIEYA